MPEYDFTGYPDKLREAIETGKTDGIEVVSLGGNAVVDITPLAKLPNLEILDLSSCGSITDLAPLAGLAKLQTINLTGCDKIRDLTPLKGLKNLKTLVLDGTKFEGKTVEDLMAAKTTAMDEEVLNEKCGNPALPLIESGPSQTNQSELNDLAKRGGPAQGDGVREVEDSNAVPYAVLEDFKVGIKRTAAAKQKKAVEKENHDLSGWSR